MSILNKRELNKVKISSLVTALVISSVFFLPMSQSLAVSPTPSPTSSSSQVVLTIDANKKITTFTTKQLAAFTHTKVAIVDPFNKKKTTFTVVKLSTILKKAGVKSSDTIVMHALDGYTYKNLVAPLIDSKALVAYEANSKKIDISKGGPIRVVFTKGTKYYDLLDAWSWSMDKITVE